MADRSGYIGRAPGDSSVTIARQTFKPTGIQTDFTFASGYDPGYIDAYLNGVRQVRSEDYNASNGSIISFTTPPGNGDVIEFVAYKAFALGSFPEDIIGNLNVGGNLTVDGTSTLGVVTGATYYGDGSGLSGVSGFATPLSPTEGDFLNQVFVIPKVLPLGAGTSVSITGTPDNGNVTFTRAGRIEVGTGSTLHVSTGTTFITNVLGVF